MKWVLQFPEFVHSSDGVFMVWFDIKADWQQVSENQWFYQWRGTEEYVAQQENLHKDSKGNSIKRTYLTGVAVKADIASRGNEVELKITLKNESDKTFHGLISDGGCFKARSDAFMDNDEVARCHIYSQGKVRSMKTLHRTIPVRSRYKINKAEYDEKSVTDFEWFWGRSHVDIDSPVIVGAVSVDGTKAVVIGYEKSSGGLQNADAHHCLHSIPNFGDLRPGQEVTRHGYILFGDNINKLTERLQRRLNR